MNICVQGPFLLNGVSEYEPDPPVTLSALVSKAEEAFSQERVEEAEGEVSNNAAPAVYY